MQLSDQSHNNSIRHERPGEKPVITQSQIKKISSKSKINKKPKTGFELIKSINERQKIIERKNKLSARSKKAQSTLTLKPKRKVLHSKSKQIISTVLPHSSTHGNKESK